MQPKPLILAFDTSTAHCAVALLSGESLLAEKIEDMAKGQNERLIPICQELLNAQGVTWADLSAIGVCTGPGNFTGIRIAVSTARGFSLALGITAIGVTLFEAMAFGKTSSETLKLPARPGYIYIQKMENGQVSGSAQMVESDEQVERDPRFTDGQSLPEVIARIAARQLDHPTERPKPFYIRPADAAPSRDAPISIVP